MKVLLIFCKSINKKFQEAVKKKESLRRLQMVIYNDKRINIRLH